MIGGCDGHWSLVACEKTWETLLSEDLTSSQLSEFPRKAVLP